MVVGTVQHSTGGSGGKHGAKARVNISKHRRQGDYKQRRMWCVLSAGDVLEGRVTRHATNVLLRGGSQ